MNFSCDLMMCNDPIPVEWVPYGDKPSLFLRFGDCLDHFDVSVSDVDTARDLIRRINESFAAAMNRIRQQAEKIQATALTAEQEAHTLCQVKTEHDGGGNGGT